MPYSESLIASLLLKRVSGDLSPEETIVLQEWCALSANNAQLYDQLLRGEGLPARLQAFAEAAAQAALVKTPAVPSQANHTHDAEINALMEAAAHFSVATANSPVTDKEGEAIHRGKAYVMGRRRWRIAAAVAALLGLGGMLYYLLMPAPQQPTADVIKLQETKEVNAAGYKATLTLADGSVISLDSNNEGAIAQQGNSSVIKTPDGEIRYEKKGVSVNTVMMNTMSTPKGGQYRLMLPDGTKVWLNAASSVTYPAAFVGNTRSIKMTGEAYFEVAKDKTKPFLVDINGEGAVEVLGTEFNINAYKDHGDIRTTLVEGKLRASAAGIGNGRNGTNNKTAKTDAVILAPGQQAIEEGNKLSGTIHVTDDIDMAQVLAWKNGIFNFNGASFETLMKEVERWYDVEVKYEGAVPNIRFKGKMDRAVKLSGVIRFMQDYGVHAVLEGRTLLIKEK